MRYEQAFKYAIDRPGGWNNVLLVAVCVLLSPLVIGQIVLLGYLVEVTRRLIRDPQMKNYPDFSLDRLGNYLQLGIWPFVVQLIVSAAVFLVVSFLGGIPLAITTALDVPLLGVVVVALISVVASVASVLVMWPGTLHAQLTQQFDVNGLKAFVPAFWRVLGVKAYVSLVVFWLIATALCLVGLLLCIVGVLPVSALVTFASQHLLVQHYRAYLDAGGTPIGKTAPPPPPPAAPESLNLD
jgi:hypothetical protein